MKNDLERRINIDKCGFFLLAPASVEIESTEGETEEELPAEKEVVAEGPSPEGVEETPERRISECLIVTHGDLDGVLSAVALIQKEELHGVKTLFTTPGDVNNIFNLVNIEEYKYVYVCDIAPNNKNLQRTNYFIERLGDRLVTWYDHHNGWDTFKARYLKYNFNLLELGFVIDEEADSCAELITEDPFMVEMARTADTGGVDFENDLGYILNTAIKDAPRDFIVKYNALRFLLLYLKEGDDARNTALFGDLKRHSEHYSLRISNTEKVIDGGEIKGNTYVMHSYRDEIDFTYALMEGYKKAPFAVILTRRATGTECGACHTIAPPITPEGACGVCGSKLLDPHIEMNIIIGTNTGINLLRIFELESGQPFRVTIQDDDLDKVVEMLNQVNV
ncbi:MAG: hypothetical protein KAU14_09035 [Thermoplasmata archaeon]|nr:hypothetical protein [Thermoplasmata archaeon]